MCGRIGPSIALLVFGLCGTIGLAGEKEAGKSNGKPSDLLIGNPLTYKNLSIFPVRSRAPKMTDRFLTLDEGLKAGTVKVFEVGADRQPDQPRTNQARARQSNRRSSRGSAVSGTTRPTASDDDPFANSDDNDASGADVNTLLVSNLSDRPLYLMPGEILSGGYQDRTVAEELVIAPKSSRIPVDAFCVEQGRWGRRSMEDSLHIVQSLTAETSSEQELRQLAASAEKGYFPKSAGALGKSQRLSVQESKDQSRVWHEVRRQNQETGARTHSDAYTANYIEPQVVQSFRPYVEKLQGPIAEGERIVGVIVAINGKPEAADLFESTPLFRKLWPKLVKSYALDAAASQSKEHKNCSASEAIAFLRSAMTAKVDETTTEKGLTSTRRTSKGIASFSVHESKQAGIGGMGGFGGGVHSSAFAK